MAPKSFLPSPIRIFPPVDDREAKPHRELDDRHHGLPRHDLFATGARFQVAVPAAEVAQVSRVDLESVDLGANQGKGMSLKGRGERLGRSRFPGSISFCQHVTHTQRHRARSANGRPPYMGSLSVIFLICTSSTSEAPPVSRRPPLQPIPVPCLSSHQAPFPGPATLRPSPGFRGAPSGRPECCSRPKPCRDHPPRPAP